MVLCNDAVTTVRHHLVVADVTKECGTIWELAWRYEIYEYMNIMEIYIYIIINIDYDIIINNYDAMLHNIT